MVKVEKINNWISADFCSDECIHENEDHLCGDCERTNNCEWCAETDEKVCSNCVNDCDFLSRQAKDESD